MPSKKFMRRGERLKQLPRKRRKISDHWNDEYDSSASSEVNSQSMNEIIRHTQRIFDGESYHESEVTEFANEMATMTKDYLQKTKDLFYSNNALCNLLERYEAHIHEDSGDDVSMDSDIIILENSKSRFTQQTYDFIKENVLMLRNLREGRLRTECFGYGATEHFYDTSVEIAIKSNNPHREYKKIMHTLLQPYIGEISGISSIICDYCHGGYIWYYLNTSVSDTSANSSGINDWNCDGIMFELPFHPNDYFKYLGYYHKQDEYPHIKYAQKTTFDDLRETCDVEAMNKMKDEEIARFIRDVCVFALCIDVTVCDSLSWLIAAHK